MAIHEQLQHIQRSLANHEHRFFQPVDAFGFDLASLGG
jgi:hypothetical protein